MQLRPYQSRAVDTVLQKWREGQRRVLLVSPTGSGKTRMGQELVQRVVTHGHPALWVAHRDELITQARDRIAAALDVPVGVIAADYPETDAPIQVSSVQTLAVRGHRPPARLVVLDEAHHYLADEWNRVATYYQGAALLGLTATPERGDGRPMGDLFDELVVAAKYSELVAEGHLVPCRVFRPNEALMGGLAQDPVGAYLQHGEGGSAFFFCPTVRECYAHAAMLTAMGAPAEVIEQGTPFDQRRDILARFRSGTVRVICNVYTMTEGVDVPDARVCVLARGVGHVSTYLQMVGRVLRPAPGKEYGVLIDLPGASIDHGLPTADREYSLGEGIRMATDGAPALRVCLSCGMTFPSGPVCPRCGFELREEKKPIRIYNRELAEVFAGSDTPDEAKRAELERLLAERAARGWALGFVIHEYERMFGERPDLSGMAGDEKRREFKRLLEEARRKGYSPGWAKYRYKARFGVWP